MNVEADTGGKPTSAMHAALAEVERWRTDSLAEVDRREAHLHSEAARLKAEIAELQRQLQALDALHIENSEKREAIAEQAEQQIHGALLKGLEGDAALLTARAADYAEALEDRDAAVAAMLEAPGTSEKVDAFEKFERDRSSVLAALPTIYHAVIFQQHEVLRQELAPLFQALSSEISPLPVPPAEVTLVASIDPAEGSPEALAVLLPVPFDIYAQGSEREEDLLALVAYRVVGAVSGALKRVGAPDAPVQYAPYEYGQGQLAIQVWLADSAVSGDLRAALEAELATVNARASEVRACALRVAVSWQSPEVIAPGGS